MLILSLVSDVHRAAVDHAAPRGVLHRYMDSGASLIAAIRQSASACVIVDPECVTDVPFDRVAEAAATSLSLLILGRLSRLTCESYLVALTIRATNVLLANMGDIDRLWFLLHEPFLTDVSARLLHSAADTVAALPTRLRVGTVGIFAGSAIPRSALAFGTAIGANERMIQRWYVRVGLTGVAHVLSIARLALAWRRMRSHRLSLARVAKLAGYGSTRTLSRNCQIFAGGHAAVVREYTASELADRLSLHLLRGSAR